MAPSNTFILLARALAMVTFIIALLLPLSAAGVWFFWDQLAPLVAGNLGRVYDVSTLGWGARLAGFVFFFFAALLQSYGLLSIRQTFLKAAEGEAYSAEALIGFRRFAFVSLLMVFIGILEHTVLILIFSLSDPSHDGALSILFGSKEIKAIFMALLLVFVSHVLVEGKGAIDENKAFL